MMRCRGVGGEEGRVKCGCMRGCCECARLGMRSWWHMMQVAVIMKTNRFGAAARQSQVSPPRAHIMIEDGSSTQWSSTGKEDTEDFGLKVVGEGMGRGNGESITANNDNDKEAYKCHQN